MIFSGSVMAVAGVVPWSVIRSYGEMPPGGTVEISTQDTMMLGDLFQEQEELEWTKYDSVFQIFNATYENDLVVCLRVFA